MEIQRGLFEDSTFELRLQGSLSSEGRLAKQGDHQRAAMHKGLQTCISLCLRARGDHGIYIEKLLHRK